MVPPIPNGTQSCVHVQITTKTLCRGEQAASSRNDGPTVFSPANSIPAWTATEVWQNPITCVLDLYTNIGRFCILHDMLELTRGGGSLARK